MPYEFNFLLLNESETANLSDAIIMDPVSVLGVASGALTIAGAVGKAVAKLKELSDRYKNAPLSFTLIGNHLNTLRSALEQVSAWSDRACSPNLISSTHNAVEGISRLVEILDENLQTIDTRDDNLVSKQSKLGFLWNYAELKEYLDMLNIQILSLSVLLNAYTCRTLAEQEAVLGDEQNKQAMRIAEDASSFARSNKSRASWVATSSLYSQDTGAYTTKFSFDREVAGSLVYRTALRSNMHTRSWSTPGQHTVTTTGPKESIVLARATSSAQKETPYLRTPVAPVVALLGSSGSGKSTILRSMEFATSMGSMSKATSEMWRTILQNNVLDYLRTRLKMLLSLTLAGPDTGVLAAQQQREVLRFVVSDGCGDFNLRDIVRYFENPSVRFMLESYEDHATVPVRNMTRQVQQAAKRK